MSLITYNFDLFVTPIDFSPIIKLSQYDDSRTYVAHLKADNGSAFQLASGATATFEGVNSKGVAFQIEAEASGDTVTFTPKDAATDQPGRINASICIKSGGEQLTPLAVRMEIQKAGATKEEISRSPGFTDVIDESVKSYLERHPIAVQVDSVNGKTGEVVLNASDVNAIPSNAPVYTPKNQPPYPVRSVNGQTGDVVIQTGGGDAGDGAVSSVNGKVGTVVLTASDVGALPYDTFIPSKTSELVNDAHFVTEAEAGVSSVNGQTGVVLLTTSDISNTSGYITAKDIPQEVPIANASVNGMVLGVDNGRYTFVRMAGGISDVYMDGASIVQSGTTIAAIPKASTTRFGVIKLYDGTDSTSKDLAPTVDALRGVAQRVGNLETRSANWLTETQIKELIDSMVQEQIAMYQRRVFALEDNKKDIDITSLSDLTSHDILYGDHWKQIGTNYNYGAVLYNPESKTIGGSSSDLIYLKRGYIIGVSKNSWFVTSDQNWHCSHVFLSYPKMQAIYAYDEENNIRYTAAEIPAEIVEQTQVLAEDFLSQIESLETEI